MKKLGIILILFFACFHANGQANLSWVYADNIFYCIDRDSRDTIMEFDTIKGVQFHDATFLKIGFSYYPTSGLWTPVWDAEGDSLAWGEMEIGGGSLDTLFFTDNKFIKEGYTYYPTSGLWSPVYDADGDSLTWGEMELGGGSGTPGGSPGDIQYDSAGYFGGAPMTTDGTDITVSNSISARSSIVDTSYSTIIQPKTSDLILQYTTGTGSHQFGYGLDNGFDLKSYSNTNYSNEIATIYTGDIGTNGYFGIRYDYNGATYDLNGNNGLIFVESSVKDTLYRIGDGYYKSFVPFYADVITPNTIKNGDSYVLDFTQTNEFTIRDNSEDVVLSIINYNDGTGDFMSFESDTESMMRLDGKDSSCVFQGDEFRFENMTGSNQLQITPATTTKCLFAVTGYITADSIVTTLGTSDWVFENREDWNIKDHKDFTDKNNYTPEMGKARGMSIGRNIEALEAELEKAYIFIYELEERLQALESK